jgi:hypothetical protein
MPERQRHLAVCLRCVVDTFIRVQQERHEADYNNGKVWTRTETADLLLRVGIAFAAWETIRQQAEAQEFLVSLLLRER